MVEPKAFQDALLAYHARPCDAEAEAVRGAVLTDQRELLQEAAVLIDSMATWFRSQPMGCPPAGTAQWQARVRKVLAAGVGGNDGR